MQSIESLTRIFLLVAGEFVFIFYLVSLFVVLVLFRGQTKGTESFFFLEL